ncbi:FHA domain-containing protein [archaeon]|nr:MAG: FHA domain-containing protein [archaeon]
MLYIHTLTHSTYTQVGDCFRLGSVGVVVSELKLEGQEEEKLDNRTLQFLKDEALAFDTSEDLAALASDEMGGEGITCSACLSGKGKETSEDDERTEPNYQAGLTNGEKFICYMCYETHNTFEDPLIAPCECKGDTRFLHVQCLQKWYYSSAQGSRAQVIRTTGNGAPACKICGTAYKTNFKRQDGRKASILEMENNGPYLSLVVVTHHDTNPGLFNTKFRLNFGRRANAPPHLTDEELNTIVIGRSSSCNMILDYRTVSTIHAKIAYDNGQFVLTDNRSSNGTMVYLQRPFSLPYSQSTKLRMGRTTLTVMAKRSWTAALRSYLTGSSRNRTSAGTNQTPPTTSMDASEHQPVVFDTTLPTPVYIHDLLCSLPISPQEKNEGRNDSADHEFLHARSYTIRTLNDASAEGADFDRDIFNPGLYGMPNLPPHMPPHMQGTLFPTHGNQNFLMNLNAPSGQAMLYLNPNHTNSNGTFDIDSNSPTRLFNQVNAALRPGYHGAILTTNTLIADAGQGEVGEATGQPYAGYVRTQDEVDVGESRQTQEMLMQMGGREMEGDRECVEEWLTSPQPTEGPADKLEGQDLEETYLSLPPLFLDGKRSGKGTQTLSESKTEEQVVCSPAV